MDYQSALDYIEGLAVFGSRPGMERITALLERLGNPQNMLSYIHVAGTNGKGSVCNTLSSVLTCAGYKTGLFTSPYILDFRERIQFNGNYIEKSELCDLTSRVKPVADALAEEGLQPTEFEVITALAFLYFKEKHCDIVILEVGLGGLLDSTNVIKHSLISVITSVSLDHMAVLGNTISEIAAQKAGIIKKNGCVITGCDQNPDALFVIQNTAAEKNAEFIVAHREFELIKADIHGNTIKLNNTEMTLHLPGRHQLSNLNLSSAVLKKLKSVGYTIEDDAIKRGIENVFVPARFEITDEKPLTIVDGSHNPDGARVLSEAVAEFLNGKRIILVIGMMADKDYVSSLSYLAPLADTVIAVKPGNPRALSAEALRDSASKYCKNCIAVESPCEGFAEAKKLAGSSDCILVAGSLYLAGDIL